MGDRTRRAGLALLLVLALVACGRQGEPQPPEDVPDTYPKTYPSR